MAFEGEKLRISCMCEGEEIALDFYPKEIAPSIDLSFWAVGRHRGGSQLTYTIRQIIQLLKTGEPYTDMVVLNSKEAMKLGKKLVELAPQLAKIEKEERDKNRMLERAYKSKKTAARSATCATMRNLRNDLLRLLAMDKEPKVG